MKLQIAMRTHLDIENTNKPIKEAESFTARVIIMKHPGIEFWP